MNCAERKKQIGVTVMARVSCESPTAYDHDVFIKKEIGIDLNVGIRKIMLPKNLPAGKDRRPGVVNDSVITVGVVGYQQLVVVVGSDLWRGIPTRSTDW